MVVPVLVCVHSSCKHTTNAGQFERLELKVVMQNEGDFVDVILLYTKPNTNVPGHLPTNAHVSTTEQSGVLTKLGCHTCSSGFATRKTRG